MKWNTNTLPEGKHDGSVWKKAYSDDVLVIDANGETREAFYDYQYKNWNCVNSQVPFIDYEVIGWVEFFAV